jgi:MFS family permease
LSKLNEAAAPEDASDVQGRIGWRAILLYALAYVGAFISFIPFFSILLPLKVEAVEAGNRLHLLSLIAIWGAVAASLSNILFGMLSDRMWRRRGTRRPWISGGLACTILAYAAIYASHDRGTLLGAVILLQIGINIVIGPLLAVLADEVPDTQRGLVAGLLGIAHPLASLLGAALVLPPFAHEGTRSAILCLAMAGAILPFLLLFREGGSGTPGDAGFTGTARPLPFVRAIAARFLVQVAGTAISTYAFLFFRDGADRWNGAGVIGDSTQRIAAIMAVGTICSILLTLVAGHLSDRWRRRKPLLALAAAAMTVALPILAYAPSWLAAAGAYILFMTGYSAFIALHAAFTMAILPAPLHRGRDLGILNLTNTIPSVGVPLLILSWGPSAGLPPIFAALAGLTALGGLLMLVGAEDRNRGRTA